MFGNDSDDLLVYDEDTVNMCPVPGSVDWETLTSLVADGFAVCTVCYGATDHVGADVVNGKCECGADALCGVFELLSQQLIIVSPQTAVH